MQNFTNPTRLKETALNVGNFCREKTNHLIHFEKWDFVFGAKLIFFMKNNKDKKLFRSFYKREFLLVRLNHFNH